MPGGIHFYQPTCMYVHRATSSYSTPHHTRPVYGRYMAHMYMSMKVARGAAERFCFRGDWRVKNASRPSGVWTVTVGAKWACCPPFYGASIIAIRITSTVLGGYRATKRRVVHVTKTLATSGINIRVASSHFSRKLPSHVEHAPHVPLSELPPSSYQL